MRRHLMLLMALLIAVLPAVAQEIEIQPEGYTYCGYMPGGITFLIPKDMVSYELYEEEKLAGILIYAESQNCSIQLRRFEPDQMTMPQFLQLVQQKPRVFLIREIGSAQQECCQQKGQSLLHNRISF